MRQERAPALGKLARAPWGTRGPGGEPPGRVSGGFLLGSEKHRARASPLWCSLTFSSRPGLPPPPSRGSGSAAEKRFPAAAVSGSPLAAPRFPRRHPQLGHFRGGAPLADFSCPLQCDRFIFYSLVASRTLSWGRLDLCKVSSIRGCLPQAALPWFPPLRGAADGSRPRPVPLRTKASQYPMHGGCALRPLLGPLVCGAESHNCHSGIFVHGRIQHLLLKGGPRRAALCRS